MIRYEEAVLVEETGAGSFQVRVETGDTSFLADEPVEVGGLSSGPDPFALAAAALGACTVMTMRVYARHKGWDVGALGVCVRHIKAGAGAQDRFECVIRIPAGTDGDTQQRLLAIAGKCPVHRMLERGAVVGTRLVAAEFAPPHSEGLHGRIVSETCATLA